MAPPVPSNPPEPLRSLLDARSQEDRDRAWGLFLERHSKLILHVARRASSDEDDVMDRYTYVLDRLREDDFRRLRAFSLNGTGKFTTWLVVVLRRLCIDHHRVVFGREERADHDAPDPDRVARRNLASLVASEVEPDQLVDADSEPADLELVRRECSALLETALGELESRDRLLLTLRYVDGHPPERVARMLGFSSRFAVRRRITSLLASLRNRLEQGGFER